MHRAVVRSELMSKKSGKQPASVAHFDGLFQGHRRHAAARALRRICGGSGAMSRLDNERSRGMGQ
jgi:hypothetical protein